MMRRTADAVIVGGGVMGCSILYQLARLGVTDSLLLERDVLGSGSTGRSSAICRMHYSNPVTASMAWQSLKVFSNFDDVVGGSSGFVKTGYLVIVEEVERPGLERNVAMQQELNINTGLVTEDDVKDLAPMVAVTLVGFGEDEEVDVDGYNEGVDMAAIPDTLGKLAARMPATADSYFRGGWSGLYTTTPDWHPILDQVPGIEGLYRAVGFSGHGFKLSPMIGAAMAELMVQGRAASVDISPLRFTRFAEGDLMSSSYRYRVLA